MFCGRFVSMVSASAMFPRRRWPAMMVLIRAMSRPGWAWVWRARERNLGGFVKGPWE